MFQQITPRQLLLAGKGKGIFNFDYAYYQEIFILELRNRKYTARAPKIINNGRNDFRP